jgi:outer membrane phospholipase A
VLHESNGLGFVTQTKNDQLANSRSWNRIYAGTRWVVFDGPALGLMLDVTAWVPFGDDIVDGWPDGATVDGRIAHSIGYGELLANFRTTFGRLASFNWRFVARARSLDAELRWSLKKAQILDTEGLHGNGFRLDLLARCFFGKGERLMVANEHHTSCYAGVGL